MQVANKLAPAANALEIDRHVGLWDTAAMPRIFDLGRRAAESQLHAIRRMLDVPIAA